MQDTPPRQKILIVEDEMALRQVLSFFLKQNDYEVLEASNGQEAIRIIAELEPQLIILDLVMRPVSGWEVLHWLRDQQLLSRIPVLVVSALVRLQEQMHGFEEGAIEYVTKPTRPSLIVERVKDILSLSTEQRIMLRHKHLDDQRKTIENVFAPPPEGFAY
ncbi:MAG: response regulator [Ktedonobacteraceae bacterium]|nr:response regulator [Ktedonobacteraceae bacterium]